MYKLIQKNISILNLENTKNKKIIIHIAYKEIMDHSRLSFHTELGKVLPERKQNLCKEDYVLLATVQTKHSFGYVNLDLAEDDIKIADQYLRNQTNSSKK